MQLKTIHQRKRKYILLILLLIAIGLTKGYAYDFSAVCSTGQTLYYNIIDADNHYVELTCPGEVGYNGWSGYTQPTGDLIIPDSVQYDGATYLITTIGDYAFYYCFYDGSATLTLPNSLQTIGNSAFSGCWGFTGNLTIPNSVTTIGHYAFSSCSGFTGNLTIPNSVTTIGNSAFSYCSGFTGSLTIPNSVSSIGQETFYGCSGFTGGLTIPNSVTSIGYSAFSGCSGMTGGVFYTGDLTQWCNISFSNEGSNPLTCAHNLYISNELVTNLVIPEDVIEIKAYSFCGATCLTSLVNSNSVTTIGSSAFYGCSGFTGSLTIPNSVTTIGNYAFFGCSGFTGNLAIPNSVTTIGSYVFSGCSGFTGNLTIPNSVTTIGDYAFFGCSGFTGNLTIPNSVFSIGWSAFSGCTGFTEIFFNAVNCSDASSYSPFSGCGGTLTIGDEVERIPSNMFRNSGFMGSLTIPNSVTSIGNSAFYGCSGFTGSLTIPNSVTTIDHSTFYGCSGFTGNLVIPNSVTSIGSSAFEGCGGFTGSLIIHNLVTTIGGNAFKNCTGFTEVVFNAINCSSYGSPFQGCGNTLIIGDNVERIPAGVFNNCSNFTGTLTIPNSVTSIECLAFFGCSGFNEIVFNAINCSDDNDCYYSVFGGCTGTLIIGNEVERIPNRLFRSCDSFAGVVFNATNCADVNGLSPFCDCGGTLTIGNSVVRIPASMFENCHGFIGSLTIPNSVTSIGNFAFYGCNGLTGRLTIGESVTIIGNCAFEDCSGFTSIRSFAEVPPSAVASTFYNVNYTIPVSVPYGSIIAYQNAEGWNHFYNYSGAFGVLALANPEIGGWVTGGGLFLEGEICTLTANPNTGYYFVNWTKDGDEVSTETTLSFPVMENATYIANFAAIPRPDLHVTSITNTALFSGQQATVSWTVKNDGEGSTPVGETWNDYIWITSTVDLRINDPNDIHLATVGNLRALDPGESYTNSVTVTLPSDVTGSQYIFVLTDMVDAYNISFPQNVPPDPYTPSISGDPYYYFTANTHGSNGGGVIEEPNDYDNFFYKSAQVISSPVPDLVVTNVTHPLNIISGTSMPLSYTIENQGVATAVGSWYDAVYLSSSQTFDIQSAYYLGSYLHENGLAAGQSYTYTTNVDIPREYYDSYYVFVLTDVTNTIYESILEDNNVGRSETPVNIIMSPCPNLIVTSVTTPSAMSVNKSYDISFTVQNIGAGVATESGWNDAVYLSSDTVLDYSDIPIKCIRHNNSSALVQDATYMCNTNVTIPDSISGTMYVLVKTDKDNDVFEFLDEDDNVGHIDNPSSILIPDLSVTELWVDEVVNPNVQTEVEWTVTNNGEGLALGVLTDLIAFDSQIVDTVRTNIHLESNESTIITRIINVPCAGLSSGTISVISNADFNIIDADSTNNVIGNSVSVVSPDLLVELTSISESGWSGEPIEVKYTVTNNGTASLNGTTTDSIYISNNPNDFSDATLIYTYQRILNLEISETENVDLDVNLPDGISGTYYIGVFANANGEVCEGDNTNNNNIVSAIDVSLSPYPNLQIASLSVQSTPINIGTYTTISYCVQNVGDTSVNNKSWKDRFYISPTPSFHENTAILIGEHMVADSIAVGCTIQVTTDIMVPVYVIAGNYYLVMIVDADDEVYEYNGENDNLFIGTQYQFNIYPCDLQATRVDGPSEVNWGESTTVTLFGKNNSGIQTLYSRWYDQLYLSTNSIYGADDIELGSMMHDGSLEPDEEYQSTFNVTIPYGMQGDCYLIGIVDAQMSNPDTNPQNNFVAGMITINSVPTPDLELTELSVIDDFIGGQPSRVAYTVTNVGELSIQNQIWTDRLYLSNDNVLSNDDLQLKTVVKQISLSVGGSYTDTIEIVVPIQYGGNYHLFAKANVQQHFFEPNFNNNSLGIQVNVSIPAAGDLIVQNVISEYEIVLGESLHVSWDVKNIGENTMHGNGMKTLVYMSHDTLFDVTDKLLGSVTNSIMLPPNATTSQELTARISSVPEGEYNLIVMTNATRTFNESNFGNNTSVSNNPFNVTMRVLPFSVPLTDTLENNLANDYRLNVGEFTQETVWIHLHSEDSLQGAINHIFVTHNSVGDNLNYDYSTIEQFTANPELYIPSTQLEYYGVNVIGSTPVGDEQSIMIQADVLPFDLRSINPDYGGNTGEVTIELTGSKFNQNMTVWLMNSGETIFADTVYFQNFNKAFATFDLKDKPIGIYTIGLSSLCEGDVYLENAFEIRQGEPERLSTNIIYPNSPRPNRNIILMFEFGNTGNVDITAPIIRLNSVGGSWIALTPEDLADHETDLLIPLQIEGAPHGILRPGSYGIINIFCYTNNALVFTIKRIQ